MYKATIGLEIHCEFESNSKVLSIFGKMLQTKKKFITFFTQTFQIVFQTDFHCFCSQPYYPLLPT